jgi:hypothetical protein
VRLLLTPHPLSRNWAVDQIEVQIERSRSDHLTLSFNLTGNIRGIVMPHSSKPIRSKELWRNTCFEAFLRGLKVSQYYEFNFSPSTEWSAYKFDDYRTKMRKALEFHDMQIDCWSGENCYTLRAGLSVGAVADLAGAIWKIGLSAVVEEHSGFRSYWSLVHPIDKPDFHHPASFAHELIPPEQT